MRDISNRRVLSLPQDLTEALANYRAERFHRTETLAVRHLVRLGLELLEAQASTKEGQPQRD
jgi:hypothetical protein